MTSGKQSNGARANFDACTHVSGFEIKLPFYLQFRLTLLLLQQEILWDVC